MLMRNFLAWIALTSILGFAIGATLFSEPSDCFQYGKAHSAQKSASGPKSVSNTVAGNDAKAGNHDAEARHDCEPWWGPHWTLVWGTIALCLITGSLAFYTVRLWGATGKLVAGAEDTSRKQLRPYVGIVAGFILLTKEKRIRVEITAQNKGQTTAYDTQHFVEAEPRSFDDERISDGELIDQKWVMAPSASWTLRYPERTRYKGDGSVIVYEILSERDVSDIIASRKDLIVWGKIVYRDELTPAVLRQTKFCYRKGREVRVTPEWDYAGIARAWEIDPCVEGNESR